MDKENFRRLFDRHFDAIRRYLYYRCADTELASDVAQDLFARIWEKGMNLDPDKDKALLYKMASDMIVSKFRRRKTELDYTNSMIYTEKEHSDNNLEYKELASKYSEALTKMSENQRITFLMSRSEELKYQEIAERLNISVKAVEKRISQALGYLRKELR
ncbi:MAG: sigma-70 family RNA polymerase sigma factor [Bacteroidales bacterium]|nr:sigma-70 family RNA polymerase sigma factor [Bacteroidales bacterium]